MDDASEPRIVLPYASPNSKATRPAYLAEIGCASSALGGLAVGVISLWLIARAFVYDGPDSLVGGLIALLLAGLMAAIGAIAIPAIALSVYWIIRLIRGRQ